MKYTNKLGLPNAIYQAIANDDYDRGESDITVTQLIQPMQMTKLQMLYKDELEEDISDNIYALMGKSIHYILEKSETIMPVEKRLYVNINGCKVGGQFDRLALISNGLLGCKLQDYKIASVWEYIYGLKQEKEDQINCLAYILKTNGYNIIRSEIVMIFRDWQKSKAKYDPNYPQQQVVIIPIILWYNEIQEKFITDRVKLFQAEDIPECTEYDRWNPGDKFAVTKQGRKTALRVLNSRQEAEKWIADNGKGDNVEVRPGENRRCESYCNCVTKCQQYAKIKNYE